VSRESTARKARLGRGVVVSPAEAVARFGLALFAAIEEHCPNVFAALVAAGPRGVEEWSRHFHLDAEWCRELALHRVRSPESEPPWKRPDVWGWSGRPYPRADSPVFRLPGGPAFRVHGWNPEGPTPRGEARERMLRQLQERADEVLGEDHGATRKLTRHVNEYLARVEAEARERLPRTPPRDREHFRWAALYLCDANGDRPPGWSSFERLAKHLGHYGESTVREPVTEILDKLELTGNPQGRPPKS
jgi:hypothetical protein